MVRPSRMIRPPRNPSGLRSGTVLRRGPWRPPLGHLTPWLGGGCNRRGPQGRRGVVVLLVQPIAEPLALPMIHPGMKRSHTKSYDTLPAAQPRLLFPEQARRFLHAALLKSTGATIERGCFEPQPLPRVAPCGDGRKTSPRMAFGGRGGIGRRGDLSSARTSFSSHRKVSTSPAARMAEGVGFEPTVGLTPRSISSRVP